MEEERSDVQDGEFEEEGRGRTRGLALDIRECVCEGKPAQGKSRY